VCHYGWQEIGIAHHFENHPANCSPWLAKPAISLTNLPGSRLRIQHLRDVIPCCGSGGRQHGDLKAKRNYRRTVLRLPDLDHSKTAVLNSLTSPCSRRVYRYAIEQFIAWYCSEPRLAFNRIVVVRYRMYLEGRGLAANTINQQLAAVRRLAHEAADAGLLSPELAAGISRVKGVKQLGFRSGNWLTLEQSTAVLNRASGRGLRAKRDYAMLAMLLGCGLRRSESVGLELREVQTRQGHWPLWIWSVKADGFARYRYRTG